MRDWHYHANHVDAPARGSKAAAHKDARRMQLVYVEPVLYGDGTSSFENARKYGPDYPWVIRCRRYCKIVREEKR